jgi:hypothetical protein
LVTATKVESRGFHFADSALQTLPLNAGSLSHFGNAPASLRDAAQDNAAEFKSPRA